MWAGLSQINTSYCRKRMKAFHLNSNCRTDLRPRTEHVATPQVVSTDLITAAKSITVAKSNVACQQWMRPEVMQNELAASIRQTSFTGSVT